VSEALAVAQQQIRGAGERRQRVEDRPNLAKRQQPRHVREAGRPACQRGLLELQIIKAQHCDRGSGDAAVGLVPDVDPGDE
jgi:hypothetical protein